MSKTPMRKSRKRRDTLRQQLFVEQAGLCWICGLAMTLERAPGGGAGRKFATFDHVTPASHGGTGHRYNLKLAHRHCNMERGHKTRAELLSEARA